MAEQDPGISADRPVGATGGPLSTPTRARLVVAAVAFGAVALDVVSKVWAVASLASRDVEVVGTLLVLRLARNSGAAFSSFRGAGPVLALVAAAAIVWILVYAGKVRDWPTALGLGLVAGGAGGNLIDRVFRDPGILRGHVVDFIDLPRWPTFNVADMAVACGVALLVVATLAAGRREKASAKARSEHDDIGDAG